MNRYGAKIVFFLQTAKFLKKFLISSKKNPNGSDVYSRTVCHPALDAGSPEKSGGLRVKPAMTDDSRGLRIKPAMTRGFRTLLYFVQYVFGIFDTTF